MCLLPALKNIDENIGNKIYKPEAPLTLPE